MLVAQRRPHLSFFDDDVWEELCQEVERFYRETFGYVDRDEFPGLQQMFDVAANELPLSLSLQHLILRTMERHLKRENPDWEHQAHGVDAALVYDACKDQLEPRVLADIERALNHKNLVFWHEEDKRVINCPIKGVW